MSSDNVNAPFGKDNFPHIFGPGQIGRFKTFNRVKYASCSVSNYNTLDGFVTERELHRDEVIARTGASVLTNQGIYPDGGGEGKVYPRQLAGYDDRFIPGLRNVNQVWRRTAPAGTLMMSQIIHGGRYGGLDTGRYFQPSASVPRQITFGKKVVKPLVCVEMTKDDIAKCIADHVSAAKRLVQAGFDGVELTCFVGYLLANFLSKYTNKRTDEYGGSVEKRARFMVELIQAVRKEIGDHLVIGIRLSSDELLPGGNSREEGIEQMLIAQEAGVDYISAVVAWHESPEGSWGRDKESDHFLYSLEGIKKHIKVPIAFGPQLKDPYLVEKCIKDGLLDYWEMCRPFLADPDIVNKTARNDIKAIKKCINSLWCGAKFGKGQPYLCALNPLLGHEKDPQYQALPILWPKKVMVIGGGPAGCEAALEAAKRGHAVTIFDRGYRLGGQVLAASGDTYGGKSYLSLVEWYEEMIRRQGIDVRLGTEVTEKMISQFAPEIAILATGAKVKSELRGANQPHVFNALDILKGLVEPKGSKIVILGTNTVGFAVGHRLYDQGLQICFIEKEDKEFRQDIVPNYAWRFRLWLKEAQKKGLQSITNAEATEITENGVKIKLANGEEKVVLADSVVIVNRAAEQDLIDYLTENVDVLEIVGDAIRPRYIYTAIHEGFKVGRRV
jgi:2,4-dienoyl-CoA reductase (NADPH2)